MAGHSSTSRHGHWYADPGVRLLVIALAIVLAVFLISFAVMTESAAAQQHRGMDTWYNGIDVVGDWGWSVGSDGTIIRWPRYDDTAVQVWSIGSAYDIEAIDMVTTKVGYLVASTGPTAKAKVFKTTDGGRTWTRKLTSGVNALMAVTFRSTSLGWVAGAKGAIYRTTNGGRTWVKQRSGTTRTVCGLSFPGNTVGYAVGTGGLVLKTINAGKTWTKKASGTTAPLYSVDFVTTTIGWAAGGEAAGVCLKTGNGGKTWKPLGTQLPPLEAVDFANRTTGFVIGNDGVWPNLTGRIFKLTDGGLTWTEQTALVQPSPPDYGLSSLRVMSAKEAYAEGESEASLWTDDGGAAWHLAHIAVP